jgi:acetyl-CoA synthetase (ADP-forming)
LLPTEAQQISSLHKIPIPKFSLTSTTEEAIAEAEKIGFPVALKIVSPDIIHKSDIGGVALNIKDEKELRQKYGEMIAQVTKKEPKARIMGVMVQKMMPESTEVIIGAVRDRQFGPSIMFGIGGIFTEVYGDSAFRVAPLDRIDAWNLIHSLKGSRILEGIRGKPPVDVEAIADVLISVSNLVLEHDSISQLDLNPVIAYPNSVCAVDSRIIIDPTRRVK